MTTAIKAQTARPDPQRAAQEPVRAYWNRHVYDWKIATHEVGSARFFEETELYRFEKLDYLTGLIAGAARPGLRVLDIGCGLGNDTARFARAGASVVGIDIAERAIELSRANFAQRGLPGTFCVMSGEALALPDATFDLVYCHTVLQFAQDPGLLVREAHRVLKPGGTAIMMVVNSRSWLRFLHRVMKVEIDYLDAPVFHWFSARGFREILAHFASVEIAAERFPTRTKIHKGLKAKVFNTFFVDIYNMLPRAWVGWSAHHLIAFARKPAA